jgi:hypothetical protein
VGYRGLANIMMRPGRPRFYATSYLLAVICVIGLALAYRWPVLNTGFLVDDYAQLAMLQNQYPVPRSPLELFTFTKGSAENPKLRAAGFLPWWSHPQLKVALFRPLPGVLHWLDLRWGRSAFVYHLHSLGWWLLLWLAILAVSQRLLPKPAVLLCLLLVAAQPAHTVLLGWIANRNALVAGSLALLGLCAQLRAATDAWSVGRKLALLCYVLALCAGEYALCFLAFAAAHEFSVAPRVRALVHCGGLLVGYVLLRAFLGFGTHGSGLYLDPISEPDEFLSAAWLRVPLLAGELVFGVRASWWRDGIPARLQAVLPITPAHWLTVQLVIGGLACLLAATVLIARSRAADAAAIRFIVIGTPLSLLPMLGTLPESRVLLPAMFGWSIVLGHWLWTRLRAVGQRRQLLAAGSLWLIACVAPLLFGWHDNSDLPRFSAAVHAAILDPALDPTLAKGPVLLMAAFEPTTAILPLVRRWHDRPVPRGFQLLTSAFSRQRLSRLDLRRFRLERLDLSPTALDLFASSFNRSPFLVGQEFVAGALRVQVERVLAGRLVSARFEVDRSLEQCVLLSSGLSGLFQVQFPAIGRSVIVDPPLPPLGLLP